MVAKVQRAWYTCRRSSSRWPISPMRSFSAQTLPDQGAITQAEVDQLGQRALAGS
jgi:hypothetical protein